MCLRMNNWGFIRQLKDMKNFGEFISMDAAVELLTSKDPLEGRYFCLSFDDGMKSALPPHYPFSMIYGFRAFSM